MRLMAMKLWRLERGIEAHELARRTGIDGQRVAGIETGMIEPGAEELNRICTILRVPAHQLEGDGFRPAQRLRPRLR